MADCFTCDSERVMRVCVMSTFSFAALVSVVLRLYARRVQTMKLELNDYLSIVGLVCFRPLKGSPNADRILGLNLSINGLRNAKRHPCSPRPNNLQHELRPQGDACGTATLDHIRDFHPGFRFGSLYSNIPNTVFSSHLLRCSRLQSCIFSRRGTHLLLDMSAFRIALGSCHQRLLWRPEVSRYVHERIQPLDGRHGCCAPDARALGSSNADEPEAVHSCHVFHGSSVSTPK